MGYAISLLFANGGICKASATLSSKHLAYDIIYIFVSYCLLQFCLVQEKNPQQDEVEAHWGNKIMQIYNIHFVYSAM